MTSRSLRQWIGFAKAATARLLPQRDTTLRNYEKALLSRQIARDLERIEDFIVSLIVRGMSTDRALNVTLDVLEQRVRHRIELPHPFRMASLSEVHQAEEEAQGRAECAETAFVHDPDSLSKAMAFLDQDAAYMTARGPLIERARARVAQG